ncbi:MAG: HAD-IA family hydrolase [Alphaproteobacteria bacterium]
MPAAAPPPSSRGAILFDLDGTLVDTLPDLAGAANAFLAQHGRPRLAVERVQAMVGDGLLALAARVIAAGGIRPAGPEEAARHALRFRALYEARGHRGSALYPGVAETLARLAEAGFALAVCTNKTEAMAAQLLDQLGIGGRFATVGGSDSFGARKPDRAHVQGMLDRLGQPPARALMVGDSANDVRAASGAGVRCIVVAYGYGLQGALAAGPETVIKAFDELPALAAGLLPA